MASDEQFSLCWNNFHANMSAGFHGLLSRGDLVDVTLAAEGRLLQAHKLVLSVCSPYFQEMFKMNPTQHPIVFLKDVSHSALRDLLQFMYQGEVNVKQEELASFISTAEQLQVKGLTGNQNEESSTPSKPKPTSRPGPRSQQRQIMTKLETDLDSKPSSTPVAIKRPNRPSIASNNSSSSQSGPAKRKCVDPLEAGPSGSAKEEFVTIPDEDENNAVAPKMEPEFVNESMWDDDEEGANNDDTNFGEDDSNMEMSAFDGSATGDGNITGGGEGGAVGDAQGADADTEVPDWVLIYFVINPDNEYRCNICDMVLQTDKKSVVMLDHIKTHHKEVHDVHKDNPEATVGFRIEFLNVNEDGVKTQPIIIGEVCEAETQELTESILETVSQEQKIEESHLVLMPTIKKKQRRESESRRKSWVWKYFTRLSSIIYRCNICEVVLSIKGCNTNNMNRHVRSKHPSVYLAEMNGKKQGEVDFEDPSKEGGDLSIMDENLDASQASIPPPKATLHRRSWIWLYFERVSNTLAQCKLCHRNICHGGNATGNMNRHLKMRHNKTSDDHNWIWKVFDNNENDFFACKICQYRCMKFSDIEKSISCILHHLKLAHGVVSGEQIITSIECGEDED